MVLVVSSDYAVVRRSSVRLPYFDAFDLIFNSLGRSFEPYVVLILAILRIPESSSISSQIICLPSHFGEILTNASNFVLFDCFLVTVYKFIFLPPVQRMWRYFKYLILVFGLL